MDMTEEETIKTVDGMDALNKLRTYMKYFCNMLHWKYTSEHYYRFGTKTFEGFCNKSNIHTNDTNCEEWKEKGFASKSWMVFQTESVYHYVHHNIK